MRRFRLRRRSTRLLAALLVSVLAGMAAASAEDVRFLSVIDDLPLMAGLDEDTDAAMTFDSAQGRIVEARALGDVGAKAVAGFYAATLPALGWQAAVDGQYRRGGEALTLEIEPADGGTVMVRFALRPASP